VNQAASPEGVARTPGRDATYTRTSDGGIASGARPPPAPFVVGAARSGTTLLRLMLDAHPELAVPPETHFLPELVKASKAPGATAEGLADLVVTHRRWSDFGLDPDDLRRRFARLRPFAVGDAIRAFYAAYAERQGKPRWGDKTPAYARRMRLIERHLPEAHFVHLMRDGRDVRLSQISFGSDPPRPGKHARRWKRRIRSTRRDGAQVDHYLEVRYEDLVTEPERHLRRICDFVELDFDSAMLAYHQEADARLREMARDLPAGEELLPDQSRRAETSEERLAMHALTREPPRADRVERWREAMSDADRAEFERVAGDLLHDLGYEVATPDAPGEAPGRATA
jgi:Sulfotransferase family